MFHIVKIIARTTAAKPITRNLIAGSLPKGPALWQSGLYFTKYSNHTDSEYEHQLKMEQSKCDNNKLPDALNSTESEYQASSKTPMTVQNISTHHKSVESSSFTEKSMSSVPRKQHAKSDYLNSYKDVNIETIRPSLPPKSSNLAAYVNHSETLTNLVRLGVDLSKVEKNHVEANYILKLDFKKDIEPYLHFLHSIGIPDSELGKVITRNPGLFQEDLDHLETRMNYLESKMFSKEDISRVVCMAPQMLSVYIKDLDTQLGYLQQEFQLTGNEVRAVVTKCPRLTIWKRDKIKQVKFTLDEFLGFTTAEIKQILLDLPKIYLSDKNALTDRFDYLHNTVGLTHKQILLWPNILRSRLRIIQQRHQFLKQVARDQFDPTKQNYVSTRALVTGKDVEFCEQVAKVPVEQYNAFLKTI